ncbi:Gluconolactonase [Luteitalea pratensis]|uniref:Gluconolactonase n=2 Tax=Luteitalea pratensis TaxID=1855912 RepID=A0A143PLJ5_LUTPR|nr:Gluconolactonase [Luteitalea pratensis]
MVGLAGLVAAGGLRLTADAPDRAAPAVGTAVASPRDLVEQYCLDCHDNGSKKADLSLEAIMASDVAAHAVAWEKVVKKLRTRQMPPIGEPRPDDATYEAIVTSLETDLDRAAAAHPNPGRPATIRRLTRTEYGNAIRDLLALDVDVSALLPADESSYGFDNVTVGELSPTLLERYLSAAEKISRLAVGRVGRSPGGDTFRVAPDLTQEEHIGGLPLGTRGGTVVSYTFPQDGEYDISIRLRRDRDEKIEGLTEAHEVEVLLDRASVQTFAVQPQRPQASGEPAREADAHLTARLAVRAGPHVLGVTFPKKPSDLPETARQPYQAHFNSYRHPRLQPAIYSVSIVGPLAAGGPGDTPSRRRIFGTRERLPAVESVAARNILGGVMFRAYRRPVTPADLEGPMILYRQGRASGDFDAGIEMALAGVLVSPSFLFRVETDPASLPAGTPYRISDLALASRLSFFLWSSIPDDELLEVAIDGTLRQPAVLERQVRRMLADDRSRALVTNFAAQWLHLRSLEAITPDMRLFPDFDDNLRQAFRQETELFVDSILREDRSALDLLRARYTFLNERLAKHYGIGHVYGSRFRRVALDDASMRGGLLRQGSILTVTSYATRTSPVLRGKWVLDNLLGVPPPAPPPDVPALKDNTVDGRLSGRMRLAEHRQNKACARCHNIIDPVGLSLETFDAVGRRRQVEDGVAIDASGGLPDGRTFTDVTGLEAALLARPELLASTITEKLLTYACGRGVEPSDAPAVRAIVRAAQPNEYRLSSIVLGVVQSEPFQMRTSR